MKFLGIDYGTKKVGIALSDDRGVLAFPLSVIATDKTLIPKILEIISKHNIEEVVIGRSLNFKQEENKVMDDILLFKDELASKFKGNIHFQNETLSSREASNIQVKDENLDARAAAIILQSFIDSKK